MIEHQWMIEFIDNESVNQRKLEQDDRRNKCQADQSAIPRRQIVRAVEYDLRYQDMKGCQRYDDRKHHQEMCL